jgi:hypothetical protein
LEINRPAGIRGHQCKLNHAFANVPCIGTMSDRKKPVSNGEGQGASAERVVSADAFDLPEWNGPRATIPALSTSRPWTTPLVIYWTAMWLALLLSFIWGVYTLGAPLHLVGVVDLGNLVR